VIEFVTEFEKLVLTDGETESDVVGLPVWVML